MKIHLPRTRKIHSYFLKYVPVIFVALLITCQLSQSAFGQDTPPGIQVEQHVINFALYIKIISVAGIAFGWIIAIILLRLSTKSPDNPAFQRLITKGLVINLTTVALLLECVLILGVLGLIESEAIAAILSGIAGYVLGSARSIRQEE